MEKKYFGTDGIRGRVGQFPITPEFCLRLGWAVGRVFAKRGKSQILIGKDTRISGYMLESVLESGLASAGVDVGLLGPMPTPAIAYLTRTLRADAGIVISASHNAYYDNGIKFFDGQGNKLADDVELEIEAQLETSMVCVSSDQLGRASRLPDAAGRYIEFCKATVDRGFRLNGLRVVLDCGHGATYHVAPGVFEELGADTIVIGADPNGMNINDECGATHTDALEKAVVEHQADVGVALDGDADRLIMVDEKGHVVDGDQLVESRGHDVASTRAAGLTARVGAVVGAQDRRENRRRRVPGPRRQEANAPLSYTGMSLARPRGWALSGELEGETHPHPEARVAALARRRGP